MALLAAEGSARLNRYSIRGIRMRKTLAVAALLASAAANSVPVRWELVDVSMLKPNGQFDPPTEYSLSGYFVYDADLDAGERYLEVDITGGLFGDYILGRSKVDPSDSVADDRSWFFDRAISSPEFFQLGLDSYYGDYVYFEYDSPLTNAGGTANLSSGYEFSCAPIEGCGGIGDESGGLVWGGSLVGAVVPVPAAIWLFGSALAGLGWMRRKQTV